MSSPSPAFIRAQYRLRARGSAARELADTIALEQTVELPHPVVRQLSLKEPVLGDVEEVGPDPQNQNASLAWIKYPVHAGVRNLSGLINLLYGNISMLPGIRLIDLELPASLLKRFTGPQQGMAGLRRIMGVYGRPFLATALKPRGLRLGQVAGLVHDFAAGGGDLIKDDQNLIESDFHQFKARVSACLNAVNDSNAKTGRRCLYFPHLAGPAEQLEERAAWLQQIGVRGVLLCPFVIGLDAARALAESHGLIYMAHPALSGVYTQGETRGIAHEVLLGTLLRLGGADIVIFPDAAGRFDWDRAHCNAITERLRQPLDQIKPSCPAPSGGMQYEDLGATFDAYGADAMFLIGGALQAHDADFRRATSTFAQRIKASFKEQVETPPDHVSACEMPAAGSMELLDHLRFRPGFDWEGRSAEAYKESKALPFQGIRRVELMGKAGEKTHFELRYFEVAPGGFTSLEKHNHTHVIIGARGGGVMLAGGEHTVIKPMDIAYIAPLKVHQFRNEGVTPFGFFCIVDRERDRPVTP